jgi:hypothetical protein
MQCFSKKFHQNGVLTVLFWWWFDNKNDFVF